MKQSEEIAWIDFIRKKMTDDSCKGISHYQQLAEAFLSAVESGVLPTGTRLPPDSQLAGLLGFSHITLGRALNELRKHEVVERSRAHGTFITNNLGEKQEYHSRTVAILFDDIELSTFNTGLFQQLYKHLSQKEYKILFFSAGGSGQEQADQLMDLMKRKQCIGAIVWSIMNRADTEKVLSVKPVFWPVVFMNTMFNPVDISADNVVFDNFNGCREIALRYWRTFGRKIIFASTSFLLERSLHKEYVAEMKRAIGEENVKVFVWDRDPISTLIHRKDHSLLFAFDDLLSLQEEQKKVHREDLGPCISSCAGVDPHECKNPALFSSLSELAKLSVDLLERRLKSPQSAYRHERTSFRLLNTDNIFTENKTSPPLKAGKGEKQRKNERLGISDRV